MIFDEMIGPKAFAGFWVFHHEVGKSVHVPGSF